VAEFPGEPTGIQRHVSELGPAGSCVLRVVLLSDPETRGKVLEEIDSSTMGTSTAACEQRVCG